MNRMWKGLSIAGLLLCASWTAEAQQIIGHRGSVWGVENTRAAFINAAKAGAVGLECDIRNSKDGLFVINHDSSLKRLGGSEELIWEQNASRLLTTDLQQERDGICYVGQVMALGDYLDLCKELDQVPVIEIKECTTIRSDAKNPANDRFDGVPALMSLIAEKGLTDRVVIISFMQSVMDHIWKNYPGVHLQFLTGEDWRPYAQWCIDRKMDLDIHYEKADAELVKRFHEAGLKVNVWTVDDPVAFKKMQEIGVDYITTLKATNRMQLAIDRKDIDKFLMIGDKVLIKPKNPQSQTKSGLYLPPTVQQDRIQAGYIIKTGPGYPLPSQTDEHEVWEKKEGEVHYLPLQAKEGDLAVYLQNSAYEINFNDEKYLIVPHSAILMLIRDEGLFE